VVITKGNANQDTTDQKSESKWVDAVVSKYEHLESGRTVVVKGGTPQDMVLEWLDIVVKAGGPDFESKLSTLVRTHHDSGLMAVEGTFPDSDGTFMVFSWGGFTLKGPFGQGYFQYEDRQTGRVTTVHGDVPGSLLGEWLGKVIGAQSEADLNKLIAENHAKGLFRAVIVLDGVRIETTWRRIVTMAE